MLRVYPGTEAECRAVAAAVDKALGYPRRGEHVGEGRHVVMPEAWDGTGECPPGWTATHEWVWADANGCIYSLSDETVTAALAAGSVLSQTEKNTVVNASGARVTIVDYGEREHLPLARAENITRDRP